MKPETIFYLPWLSLRGFAVIAGYVTLYVALAAADLLDPIVYPFGPPWNPAVGLALALLLMGGVAYVPLVAFAAILANVLVRDFGLTPFAVIEGLATALIYGAATRILMHHLRLDPRLGTLRDTVRLLSVAIGAAIVHAAILLAFRHDGDFLSLYLRHWVGDVLGIVVITPFLMLYVGEKHLPRPSLGAIFEAFSIVLVLWVDFGLHASQKFRFFYLLFAPLVWIAVRHGLKGATAGILLAQVCLLIAVEIVPFRDPSLTLLQIIMLTLSVTALLLGSLVSEQRRARAALKAIVTMAPDGVVTIDEAGIIESANPACERLFGVKTIDLLGRSLTSVLPAWEMGVLPFQGEIEAVRQDGTVLPVDIATSSADLSERHLFVVIIRDISQRKAMEARLWERHADLANVARLSVSEKLATALAHQLNQPLSAVIGYTRASQRLLRGGTEPIETILAAMDKAVVQAERSGEIIRRTRDFLSSGNMDMSPISVADLIDDAARVIGPQYSASDITLRINISAGMPQIMADPLQVEQVLINLLHNARDAILAAGMETRIVQISATSTEPGFVDICVADSGPGIQPDVAENLFVPFTTSKANGMGMGLFIARSIIEAHSGTMH